jgi:hypothetical protein
MMGALAPLYLAGLAALTLPVIFHLVRRTPRDRQVFSSLMFLSPSPPRLTRRSRLDQILLLLLRIAALALLAFAFARPFFRETSLFALNDLPRRRVVILLDESASMRREGLWQAALNKIEKEIGDFGPADEAALYAFSDRVRTLVAFPRDDREAHDQNPAERIRAAIKGLTPSWSASDLGSAISSVAAEVSSNADAKQQQGDLQILVISDFQKGASLVGLQSFEWPEGVYVVPHVVQSPNKTNATIQLLATDIDDASGDPRVRVSNAVDSSSDQFFIRWSGSDKEIDASGEVSVYVPPGQSRVVRLPRGATQLLADRILLRGDDHNFDNEYFTVPPKKSEFRIAYACDDKLEDAQGLLYYARLALSNDPLRQARLEELPEDFAKLDPTIPTKLFLIAKPLSPGQLQAVLAEVSDGAAVIIAPAASGESSINQWPLEITADVVSPRKNEDDFLLLGTIDYSHPIFQPFAHPKYGDFTKIHFWNSRKLELIENAQVKAIAKFDNGEPAILEARVGQGYLFAFAAGWRPDESELALSTKFVPIMTGIADLALGGAEVASEIRVRETMPLPAGVASEMAVATPSGAKEKLASGETTFQGNEEPGLYLASWIGGEKKWAVNVPAAESETTPIDPTVLEQYGVRLSKSATRAELVDRKRQQLDVELEGRQKAWQWLLFGMIGVLIFESFWASRAETKMNRVGRPSHV